MRMVLLATVGAALVMGAVVLLLFSDVMSAAPQWEEEAPTAAAAELGVLRRQLHSLKAQVKRNEAPGLVVSRLPESTQAADPSQASRLEDLEHQIAFLETWIRSMEEDSPGVIDGIWVSDRLLRYGDQDAEVARIQRQLHDMGLYSGHLSGSFDEKTEMAVVQFQRRFGLRVDGIVGPETRRKLIQVYRLGS